MSESGQFIVETLMSLYPSASKEDCEKEASRFRAWNESRVKMVYRHPTRIVAADCPPTPARDDRFPNECPRCKGPAYVGFSAVECKAGCR